MAEALERLERSVAQREGNPVASLVKSVKEDVTSDKETKKIRDAESVPNTQVSFDNSKESLEEINAKIYDTTNMVCEDMFMKESFKN